jgi:hypothetical protein
MCTDDLTFDSSDLEASAREVLAEGAGDSNKANRNSTARKQKSASVMRFLSTNKNLEQAIAKTAESDEATADAALARSTQFNYSKNSPALPDMSIDKRIAYDLAITESSGWLGLGFLSWVLSSQEGKFLIGNKENVRTMICNACGGNTERRFRDSQFFAAMCAAIFLHKKGLPDVLPRMNLFFERVKVEDEMLRDSRKRMRDSGSALYIWCTAPSVPHFPEGLVTGNSITINTMGFNPTYRPYGFRVQNIGVFLEAGLETLAQRTAGTNQVLAKKTLGELLPDYTLTIDGRQIPSTTPYIKVT